MTTVHDASSGDPIILDSPEFLADPFPFYDRLRRETPVYRTKLGYLGDTEVYVLSRYTDCVELLSLIHI